MPEPAAWPADRRITITDLQAATDRGERWSMLTSYDTLTAGVFEQAGVRALLVGDTSAEMVLGLQTTVPMTMDQLIPMVQAVVRGTRTALVVADLPFGSYEAGPEVALRNAVRHLKEGGAQAVKLEGGQRVLPQVRAMTAAGIPVMGHLGLTPQSVNTLGGVRRVQGRGAAGDQLLADARALQEAGAFAVVLESVPADLGRRVSAALRIPTVGIGDGRADHRAAAPLREAVRQPARDPARRHAPVHRRRVGRALPGRGAQLYLGPEGARWRSDRYW